MNFSFSKISTSIFIAVAGLAFLIIGIVGDQNTWFLLAAGAIMISGIIGVLGAANIFTKVTRMVVIGVLVVIWMGLGVLDYRSIKDPIEFRNKKNKRYKHVILRLKDIRQAQLGFKNAKNIYASDFNTLTTFLKNDSVAVIKAIGFVPDSLTEEKAIELGIVSRDTIYEPAFDYIFNESYMKERDTYHKLRVDSLPKIPFSGGQEFDIEAGQIERNNLMVQVFEVTAPKEKALKGLNKRLIKLENDLTVGSMTDPTTSGNWGE